ncbi:ATG10 enzyme, partial [Amia calva]|nr:ATG10 enzyme [Amia calva]
MSGELDEGERTFRLCCEQFIQHSQACGDGWMWEDVKGSEDGYMKKTLLKTRSDSGAPSKASRMSKDDETIKLEFEAQAVDEEEVDDDDIGNTTANWPELIRYEYHVVYSSSYQTPVLYFRASSSDGRPLTLEEMWASVGDHYRARLLQGPWDTITQQEHPLLGQPFFVLHPCRTQEFMSPIVTAAKGENRSLNYIIAWLSIVGPVVGLSLPLSYASAASQLEATPD